MRAIRAAWRRRRTDAEALPRPEAERARVPGCAQDAEAGPGGGVIRFERSSLLVRAYAGGAVFLAWDGAGPEPSYALPGRCPEPDGRAELEPDKDGGWRVVSSRLLVKVSRRGAVEVRTAGGGLLRRDLPPRWWDPVDEPWEAGRGAAAAMTGPRWMQRSEVAADGGFFGLGGRASGPRLADGPYRLWNTAAEAVPSPGGPPYLTMPVLLTVADAGTHLVFHDNSWDGRVVLREGSEGNGSGHDRPGRCEIRMSGGPLRYWVIAGPPARVLHGWASLTGAPAVPPRWALGYQHAQRGPVSEQEVRHVAGEYRRHGLPLRGLHLDAGRPRGQVFTVDRERFPDLPGLSAGLLEDGVRTVSVTGPAVKEEPGDEVYDGGRAVGAFVRDHRGRDVRGAGPAGDVVFPDFTDPPARKWWAGLYAEQQEQGFSGVCHSANEPVSFAAFGDRTLPLAARHALESRGGDHREGHNVYALAMAQAGWEGLRALRPAERPFLFSRSGWAGLQRYGGAWSGEVATGWEGLRASLAQVLATGLCGVPYSGPDIGGSTGRPSPELYLRWFQMSAYLPLFRTSAGGASGWGPWDFGEEVLRHCAAAMAERERLMPYLVTLAHLANRRGSPYVRPLWWQHPRDRALRDCGDAFLLGDALLVAPVLREGARSRRVRLPRGRWYDTATGAVFEGPGSVEVAAPPERIPVLARAGAAIPVTGADGTTELEVWPPAPGRTGSGLVIADAGDGWERPEAERFTVRLQGDEPVVMRESGGPVGHPVRVRGGTDATRP